MTVSRAIRYYLASKTNLVVGSVCGAVLLGGVLFASGALIPIAAAAAYVAVSTVLLFTRKGAEEIVTERDRESISANREKLADAGRLRQKLAVLRISDAAVARALEHYLLVSGSVLSKADSSGWYHPAITDNLDTVYKACGAFLTSIDEASSEKRYSSGASAGGPAAGAAGGSTARDAAARDTAARDTAARDGATHDAAGSAAADAAGIIRAAARRLDELRRSELPDAADLDTLKQLEEHDSGHE